MDRSAITEYAGDVPGGAIAVPTSKTGAWLHRFANPGRFQRLVQPIIPWIGWTALLTCTIGLVWGFFFAPADWQQGIASRIMYVHVPAAWVAMNGYAALAICSLLSIVWRHPLADIAAKEMGPVGAGFTALCLISGSLWGEPEWGTYWVWDARLTSVLILFFLYLGHMALIRAFDNPQHGYRAAAILGLVGAINLPIIVFSVYWWNSLHQGNSITLTGPSKIYITMLYPLLICTVGFYLAFIAMSLARISSGIMENRTRALLLARAERSGN
ncbi:heme ABC transporter permease [Acidiphilium cryptum]|uniref:Heme exporter protein C n=1 Tax=Acidiphilium cryptum (strain JF-5) TaxID=349163 RepID=A5G2G0_ACICJ|nr:heme ABC transporter permease [Acidiphilium cryptum]ABQ32042.1 heme exporter protein CcmC [Acidiphilium cryptum JF-5]